jgi:uncharacterized protein YbbC (DUF1343 family)
MIRQAGVVPGIDSLFSSSCSALRNKRVGLLSHPAAVDSSGCSTAQRLHTMLGSRLVCLFGPEHGFFGSAGAGQGVRNCKHPLWGIPVVSLYGRNRRPTMAMLRDLDTIVIDLQDLGVRCYTYAATMRYMLEAASRCGKRVVIADRPVPLPRSVDGPSLDVCNESFVAAIPSPMVYGMTPAETASWLCQVCELDVDLIIAKIKGYRRNLRRDSTWPPWIPPSPAIVSWESAQCYAATVFCEGLATVDCGRGTDIPFQVFGATWMDGADVSATLNALTLPGATFYPHVYTAENAQRPFRGVRIVVHQPARFRPVSTSVMIIGTLQEMYGRRRVWSTRTRPKFFDALYGSSAVREALLDGESPYRISGGWKRSIAAFRRDRREFLLYPTQ